MLQVVLSDWFVRGFLLYLLLAGCAALLRRQRSVTPLPLAFLCLAGIGEKWNHREAAYLMGRTRWWANRLMSMDPALRSVSIRRVADSEGVRHA